MKWRLSYVRVVYGKLGTGNSGRITNATRRSSSEMVHSSVPIRLTITKSRASNARTGHAAMYKFGKRKRKDEGKIGRQKSRVTSLWTASMSQGCAGMSHTLFISM